MSILHNIPVSSKFKSIYGHHPTLITKAPGRINIIGEHTDYNMGYVLPAAINYYMHIGISNNDTRRVNIFSIDFNEIYSLDLDKIKLTDISWLNLVAGVFHQLKERISGVDIVFGGNVPVGAGLSSSAALCCGTAMALSELFELSLDQWILARIAQKSEHEFAGVQCGIMDQFTCLFGRENQVLFLDCDSLDYEAIPIDINGYQFVLLDSRVKHQLNESEYNYRSEESTYAFQKLKSLFPGIENFRDVKIEDLIQLKTNEVWWKRAYHIVTENMRVLDVALALKDHNVVEVGTLLHEGHQSQRDYFEITCAETDYLVDRLLEEDIVLGARQVGGGFGGCIIALVRDDGIESMIERIEKKYESKFDIKLHHIPIQISDGCQLIKG